MTARRPAREQKLPFTEVNKLRVLDPPELYSLARTLYEAGWTLRAIGEACVPPRGRSVIRSWVVKDKQVTPIEENTHLPEPEYKTQPNYESKKPKNPGIDPADAIEIRNLSYPASKYRASMNPKHRAAIASREYNTLLRKIHDSGVPIKDIAKVAGVDYKSIYRRIHGDD